MHVQHAAVMCHALLSVCVSDMIRLCVFVATCDCFDQVVFLPGWGLLHPRATATVTVKLGKLGKHE